jgi:hypothetical protein
MRTFVFNLIEYLGYLYIGSLTNDSTLSQFRPVLSPQGTDIGTIRGNRIIPILGATNTYSFGRSLYMVINIEKGD